MLSLARPESQGHLEPREGAEEEGCWGEEGTPSLPPAFSPLRWSSISTSRHHPQSHQPSPPYLLIIICV